MMANTLLNLKTPCFIFDKNELTRSINGFRVALQRRFASSIIGYSVKTNSLPYVLCLAKENGCYAEVVSVDEYELAMLCGFEKDHVIYNGPMKSRDTFLDAIYNGAIVNIETHRELEWLSDLPQDGSFKVGLRLNVSISKVSPEDAIGENDNSRFGFSDATDEFQKALATIEAMPNVKLAGLHIHRTAHSRSISFYQNSIKYACEIIKKYSLKLDYMDVGGGYYGYLPNKPTFQQYSDAFNSALENYHLEDMTVIIEPGNAVVASCFSFLSEVIDVKHIEEERWFITTDGSRNDIDPFFRKTSYMYEMFPRKDGSIVEEQIVSGCTCLEYDRLFIVRGKPLMNIGDRLLYKNVGAYTMSLTPMFIRYLPIVYVFDNGDYQLIREKWTANEYMQKTIIR